MPKGGQGIDWRRFIYVVLCFAALLRVVLVLRGGQGLQIDEFRYDAGREAVEMILKGHVLTGFAHPLEHGDHVGFKELAILPAFLQQIPGLHGKWVPGLFFAGFSWLTIVLLGEIAFRATGSRRAQACTVLFAGCSDALFYFARHLLPYDASMACIVASLWVVLVPRPSLRRLVLAGFLAGFGFVVYFGNWSLAGFTLVTAAMCGDPEAAGAGWRDAFRRALALGFGVILSIALPIAANHLWGTGKMIEGAQELSRSIVIGDFRGHRIPWEYLWYTDYLELPIAVGFLCFGQMALWRNRGLTWAARLRRVETWSFACFWGVYLMLIVTGTILHKFAVHDRLIREMVPFLMLGAGFGMDAWLAGASNPQSVARRVRWLAALLVCNAAFAFYVPLTLTFPWDFKEEGDRILAKRTDPISPDYYFRYANVLEYYFNPEPLQTPPIEVLLRARGFYQYYPYLYEAKTPEDRRLRQTVDSSMQLVKEPILPQSRIHGDHYGVVRLRVRLPAGFNYMEPLLTMGKEYDGDAFYLRAYDYDQVVIGYFSTGQLVKESVRAHVKPGGEVSIELFSGDLMDARERQKYPMYRDRVWAKLDGQTILNFRAAPKDVPWQRVYAGTDAVFESYTGAIYTGDILGVERRDPLKELDQREIPIPDRPFALGLSLMCGPTAGRGPEPLMCVGRPGFAALVFLRWKAPGELSLGCDLWGVGAPESAPVKSRFPEPDRVEIQLGAIQPAVGARSWDGLSKDSQEQIRRSLVIRWNGEDVVHTAIPDWRFDEKVMHLSTNSIGGSLVLGKFTAGMTEAEIEPLLSK